MVFLNALADPLWRIAFNGTAVEETKWFQEVTQSSSNIWDYNVTVNISRSRFKTLLITIVSLLEANSLISIQNALVKISSLCVVLDCLCFIVNIYIILITNDKLIVKEYVKESYLLLVYINMLDKSKSQAV